MTAAKNPYVLIMASAGSGKTFNLALAYIRILHAAHTQNRPQAVERILATTFTRAAAGEIIDRVLTLLAGASQDPEKAADLAAHLHHLFTPALAAALLQSLVAHLHKLKICTLDSFLIQSAMAFAPELALPANWHIADASEDRNLRLEAIDFALQAHIDEPESREQMIDLLIKLNRGKFPREIAPTLVAEFNANYNTFLAATDHAWEVIAPRTLPLPPENLAAAIARAAAVLPRNVPVGKSGPNRHWLNLVEKILSCSRQSAWADLLNSKPMASLARGDIPTFSRHPMPHAFAEAAVPLVRHAASTLLQQLHDSNLSTRDLLQHFHQLYTFLKDARGSYSFDDFPRKLTAAGVLETLPAFFFRLDSQIDHILLDEFQDTSIPQWKLLHPLVDEIVSGQGRDDTRTLLCVGDVKQTLYAWRNAEPRLFGELLNQWPQIHQKNLAKSYRSSQIIIDAVNTVFLRLADNPAFSRTEDEYAYLRTAAAEWNAWYQKHETEHTAMPGRVRLHTCSPGKTTEMQTAAVARAAELVAERLAQSPGEQIAVLFRKKKHIPRLIELLRQRGIRAAGEGGSPLTDDPSVCAAISLLHLLDHPADTAAAYLVAHSPLGRALAILDPSFPSSAGASGAGAPTGSSRTKRHSPTSSSGNWTLDTGHFTKIRRRLADIGFGRLLSEWLTLIAPGCDARNHRRFSQLVGAAHGFPNQSDTAAFVASARELRVEDSASANVRIMSIHASKGRQFDTVILPDLDAKFGRIPSLLTRRPHVLEPFDCATRTERKFIFGLDPTLWQIYQASLAQDLVEELCGLYVAMTRAIANLEIIVHPQESKTDGPPKLPLSLAGVLRGALTPHAAAPASTQLWQAPRSQTPETKTAKQPASQTPLAVRLAPPAAAPRIRPTVSPSSLEGGSLVNLASALTLADPPALGRGTLIHRCFELIEWLDTNLPTPDTLAAAAAGLSLPPAAIAAALADFTRYAARPNIKKLLTRPAHAHGFHAVGATSPRHAVDAANQTLDLWRERPFIVRLPHPPHPSLPQEITITGIFDRVVVTLQNNRPVSAHLIDFKTDHVAAPGTPPENPPAPPAPSLADRTAHYAPQLQTYRRSLAALLTLPESAITASLAFLRIDTIVNI